MMMILRMLLFACLVVMSHAENCLQETNSKTFTHNPAKEPSFHNSNFQECHDHWFSMKEMMGFTFKEDTGTCLIHQTLFPSDELCKNCRGEIFTNLPTYCATPGPYDDTFVYCYTITGLCKDLHNVKEKEGVENTKLRKELEEFKKASNREIQTLKAESKKLKSELQILLKNVQDIRNKIPQDLPDECYQHRYLSDASRIATTGQFNKNNRRLCDNHYKADDYSQSPDWKGKGFYRVVPPAGLYILNSPPGRFHCATDGPGWVKGDMPSTVGQKSQVTYCFHWNSECQYNVTGAVTQCGGYLVYDLPASWACVQRYCTAFSL